MRLWVDRLASHGLGFIAFMNFSHGSKRSRDGKKDHALWITFTVSKPTMMVLIRCETISNWTIIHESKQQLD